MRERVAVVAVVYTTFTRSNRSGGTASERVPEES